MSVIAASGFLASGIACGIKGEGALDLALIDAGRRVPVAGVFTTSRTAAPPVILSRERASHGLARGVIVNSGSANAGTGAVGLEDASRMAEAVAQALGCDPEDFLVCSTGPIGGRLPIDKIVDGVPALVGALGRDGGDAAARAIMTTDSVPKAVTVERSGFTVGGIAKGAGMIRPDMATMLAFLTTDARVNQGALQVILHEAVAETFNALNVDGCQSTNDTVLLFASGESSAAPDEDELMAAVKEACDGLALAMARDAEGASKVVTIHVGGAVDFAAARQIGMKIADSALVRSSFYGADPNWGRVLAAAGVAGVEVKPEDIEILYQGRRVCAGGVGLAFDEDELAARLTYDFTLQVLVGKGPGEARVITTDLTPDYVKFNGERS